MAEPKYFLKSGDREKGPFSKADLEGSLRDGSLGKKTEVRAENATEWVALESVVSAFSKAEIAEAIRNLADDAEAEVRARKQRDVVIGGVICAIGIAITVLTYTSAEQAGSGRYVVAWGAIIFGGIRLARGLL